MSPLLFNSPSGIHNQGYSMQKITSQDAKPALKVRLIRIGKAARIHLQVSTIKSKHHIRRNTWFPSSYAFYNLSISIQPNAAQLYNHVLN
jgi:hypothetical protein